MPNYQRTAFSFELPEKLLAREPAEQKGSSRDDVRLLVLERKTGRVQHSSFANLPNFLQPGDILVFNASRTLPASLEGSDSGTGSRIQVRLAEHLPDGSWLALLSCQDGKIFACGLRARMKLFFDQDLSCVVEKRDERIPRLWKIRFSKSGSDLLSTLYSVGKPIRYEYLSSPWGLEYYQNVYSTQPGSMEMPSAGRAFTWRMLFDLKQHGVKSAFIVLHAGLSSYLDEKLDLKNPISEEEYSINKEASEQINAAHRKGKRVIAIGTTVVRALESSSGSLGNVEPRSPAYTRLRITSDHTLKVVDGLLTGLHEPRSSHLDLLSAFLPAEKIQAAYEEAIYRGYLWHEFGDLNLII